MTGVRMTESTPLTSRRVRSGRRTGGSGGGFTLVELLAVILVLGIVVAMVVGVSGLVMRKAATERTKQWMGVIRNAWDEYYQATDAYPKYADEGDTGEDYKSNNADLFGLLMGPTSWGSGDVGARRKAEARRMLDGLPADATRVIDGNWHFIDGFGNIMWYHSTGGAAGQPFLESAGADMNHETTSDNIRSDRL